MNEAVTSPLPGVMPGPRSRGLAGELSRRAADAWLNSLFWHSRRNPWFVRKTKPLWVWGAWQFSPWIRNNTLLNARRLLGERSSPQEREALARQVVGNFYDFVADVGRSVGATRRQLLRRIERIDGDDTYAATRRRRNGAIIVTAHMGSFEVAMAALLERERRINVLFRRDARGLFEQTRSALRRQLGVIEAPVDDGLSAWLRLREALARDEAVLIQGDRVMPGQKGCRVPFLDGHRMLPTGPVKLAMASGTPIVPVFSIRLPDGRIRLLVEQPIHVSERVDAKTSLLMLSGVIERQVRQYPEQWLMLDRAWCEDLDAQ